MTDIALLGVDWGSTNARAFAIALDGHAVETRHTGDGVFAGAGAFDERLKHLLGDWLERFPKAPILLCGMIGSDRGWLPAPYVRAPAGLDDLAAALIAAPFPRPARIVPGISLLNDESADVMRGEETLLMGIAAHTATVCLPGTHSKWVDLADGRVTGFRTYMTGELRALLLAHGALAPQVPQIESPDAFHAGLEGGRDAPTHALFEARARRLLGTLPAEHTASFVTGVLIGSELASETGTPVILAASGALAESYEAALKHTGRSVTTIDPEALAATGLLCIARAAKLI